MIEELSSQATDVKDLGSEDEVMWDKWQSEVVAGTQDNPRQLEVLKRLRCIKDRLLAIVESIRWAGKMQILSDAIIAMMLYRCMALVIRHSNSQFGLLYSFQGDSSPV